jgi:hypothetical protein
VNEAAAQFTDALVQSYKTVTERGASAQEQGGQLTEDFFNRVVENLRLQAEKNRHMTEQLADQQQRQADAAQTVTRESVDAYMNFVNPTVIGRGERRRPRVAPGRPRRQSKAKRRVRT